MVAFQNPGELLDCPLKSRVVWSFDLNFHKNRQRQTEMPVINAVAPHSRESDQRLQGGVGAPPRRELKVRNAGQVLRKTSGRPAGLPEIESNPFRPNLS